MYFRRKTFLRAADFVFFGPPRPPDPSWWTRTTLEAIKKNWSCSLVRTASNVLCQTPRRDQLRNRLYTVFQFPKRSGKSRHGTPVRAKKITASIKFLVPIFGGRPTEMGRKRSILAHSASFSACRFILRVDQKPDFQARNTLGTPPYITARKRYEQEVAAKVVLDKTAEAGSIDENRKEKILDAYKKILEAIKPIPTVPQLQPVSNGATTLTYDEALEHFVDTVRHTY